MKLIAEHSGNTILFLQQLLLLCSRNQTGHAFQPSASYRNFQPFHSFHSFHPDTHPTFAALNHLLHLPSFLYVSCRLLTSSLSLTRSHSAFLSTTHTTLRFTPPGSLLGPGRSRATRSLPVRLGPTRSTGTLASLHRPAPSRARAGLGLRGLSLSGSGRLGAPVPSRLMPTRNPPRSHPCSARADSDCRRLFTLG